MREGNGLANAILIGHWIKIGFTAKGEFRKGCGYCAELDCLDESSSSFVVVFGRQK